MILAIANQKGGVGKTTTAAALSVGLRRMGYGVLAVDLDPQANLTSTLGVSQAQAMHRRATLLDVLIGTEDVRHAPMETESGVWLIPALDALAHAEETLRSRPAREHQVQRSLEPLLVDYDVVILDTPPSLGLWVYSALAMCDHVLAPVQTEAHAVHGLAALMETVEDVRRYGLNDRCHLDGVVMTLHDRRRVVDRDLAAMLRESVGEPLFDTVIPRDVRLAEMARYGDTSVLSGDSAGAVAYRALTQEVADRWLDDGRSL